MAQSVFLLVISKALSPFWEVWEVIKERRCLKVVGHPISTADSVQKYYNNIKYKQYQLVMLLYVFWVSYISFSRPIVPVLFKGIHGI